MKKVVEAFVSVLSVFVVLGFGFYAETFALGLGLVSAGFFMIVASEVFATLLG